MNQTPDYLNEEIKHLRMRLEEKTKEVETLQLRLVERDAIIDESMRLLRELQSQNVGCIRIPITGTIP